MEPLTLKVIIAAFSAWAAKEIYGWIRGETKKNTEVTMQNTLALVELRVRLESLTRLLEQIPKLQKDIDAAHELIRQNLTRPRLPRSPRDP